MAINKEKKHELVSEYVDLLQDSHAVVFVQLQGLTVDHRSDVFSFGVMLYEMLSGRLPFEGETQASILLKHIRRNFEDVVMVSPDAGGVERTRAFAKRLNADLAIIDKRRERANECEAMHVIGEVSGKTAILLDDMVDTAGTLCGAAARLKENGAKEVHACCAHAVLSGPAIERLNESEIKSLVVTNSIPLGDKGERCDKIKVLSVGELLGEAISRIHSEDSVSYLFV